MMAVFRFEAISAFAVAALLPVAKVPVVALEQPFVPAPPAVTALQMKLLAPSVSVSEG